MKITFNDLKSRFEKNKNIIRVAKNKDNPYLILNKDCINNCNVSWSAKGLHTYLMSLPDDWEIYVTELANHTSSGRDHTYTVVNELLKYGYMEKIQYRFQGKVLALNYTVFETPIDVSDRDNTKPRIVNIIVGENGEIIEKTAIEPDTENPFSDNPDSDSTSLLYNNRLINNKINNNNDDDDAAAKLIELYKTFKVEKRVMPHTTTFLKANTHISLEVYEQIFIDACEDSVAKKFKYIKAIVNSLNENNVTTLADYEKYVNDYKESKTKTNSNSKGSPSPNKKNRFHNFDQPLDHMTEEYVMEQLEASQANKYGDKQNVKEEIKSNTETEDTDLKKKYYIDAINSNWEGLGMGTYQMAKKYAIKYNKPYKVVNEYE